VYGLFWIFICAQENPNLIKLYAVAGKKKEQAAQKQMSAMCITVGE